MKLLDIFQGIMTVRPFPSIHLGFIFLIWRVTGSWAEEIQPPPNPKFIDILHLYRWAHWLSIIVYLINLRFRGFSEELSYTLYMIAIVWYFICFLAACLFHVKHAQE